ncbi:MAG: glycoside hydrolase/phage tail family protein, partial [Hyphomicrobiaceae bacterium]|nr:glycoside hydrolase/phage tail family protein [Hyphomicrobiaceae bacterium]
IRSVVVIPGSGEFAYATTPVTRGTALGERVPENVHSFAGTTDWAASIDQLVQDLPNIENVSLVTSWFGTDLRAGHCVLRPGVESATKQTRPLTWHVAGETRATAHVVSATDGRANYGGTPSDESVREAIADLNDRGIAVTLTPFILMDLPPGNGLPDPYGQAVEQPAFPWRGRITVDPAPGLAGSADRTAAAEAQIAAFLGTASPSDFSISGDEVIYAGPSEWSYRRFILHHAFLALAAGGVDAFVIGSEMRGLTHARGADDGFPFVAGLLQLASDVKAILGPTTKVTYAADWSEYFGYQPADGSGDVYFHLDPLWASPDIDAVGIDMYWPLADWRDDETHADRAIARSVYDLDYLKSNLVGGEGYDWYYPSQAARAAQDRQPIADGLGKPWVFRPKDMAAWWSNLHIERRAGVEQPSPTDWLPQSKPIWFMETGCPAVDKGANQPNVFYDPKSAESALPYFAQARRDDLVQHNYLRAVLEGFDPAHPSRVEGLNPTSAVYSGPMLDPARIYVYAWDARPYPAFPAMTDVWGDAANWTYGHWLNGRLAASPLADVVDTLMADFGSETWDASSLDGLVPGYAIDRIMSAREALQPLEQAYFIDTVEAGGELVFTQRGNATASVVIAPGDAVEQRPGAALITRTRGQETELPGAIKVRYVDRAGDYRQLAAESRQLVGASARVGEVALPIMLAATEAQAIAETWLHESWIARERVRLSLPPSRMELSPGDVITIGGDAPDCQYRITEIGHAGALDIEARAIDPSIYARGKASPRQEAPPDQPITGQPEVLFLDLPLLRGDDPDDRAYIAAIQSPWPGRMAIYRSPSEDGFRLAATTAGPSLVGELTEPLQPGVAWRLDMANHITVRLAGEGLRSISEQALLDGANLAAVRSASGDWELVQFALAELVGERTFRLSRLLRAQAGTDVAAASGSPTGAPFVLLDNGAAAIDLPPVQTGLPANWRIGPARLDIGHPSFTAASHAFERTGRRPLSPCHVRGSRVSGDLDITWIRRTRRGGDSWEALDVPLSETSETYEVDIHDGDTVLRTLAAAEPRVVYGTAMQAVDFGLIPAEISVAVYQLSAEFGRGTARRAVL